MAFYRKIPVEIEAIKFTGDNSDELYKWSQGKVVEGKTLRPKRETFRK